MRFIARMRELAGGKPAGFKLCVGSRARASSRSARRCSTEGTAPDFIIVDGAEGGTGAAPLEYEDHVGTPLTEGLMTVHNALVGVGLRDQVKVGASGKVATGIDIVKRLVQGADYTNAARAMMMAVGCIQAQAATPTPARSASPRRTRGVRARSTCPTRPSASTATRRRRCSRPCRSWPRWASTTRPSSRRAT